MELEIQPDDFMTACALRDFHNERIERFNNNCQHRGEDETNLARSVLLSDNLTELLGDGLFAPLNWSTELLASQGGYHRPEEYR